MKQILTIVLMLILSSSYAQTAKLYNPDADVSVVIAEGLTKAKAQNKHLLLQIGGNWCPWCLKFHQFCLADNEINTFINKNYITIKVNYSKENRNLAELKKLDYPQRFGFPVFVILDADGKRIHTQNSAYLEEEKGYSRKKVLDFLSQWSPQALNPNLYLDKWTIRISQVNEGIDLEIWSYNFFGVFTLLFNLMPISKPFPWTDLNILFET